MKFLNLIKFAFILSFIFILYACNKESTGTEEQEQELSLHQASDKMKKFSSPEIINYNGKYLEFESFHTLDAFLDMVNQSDPFSIDAWEKSIGFTSQRRVFQEVMLAEDSLENVVLNLSEAEQQLELQNGPRHSTKYNYALNKGVIKIIEEENGESYWDYAIVDVGLAPVVNIDGIVKVGDMLIKYSDAPFIYVAKDGDENTLNSALSFETDYENDKILVFRYRKIQSSADDLISSRQLCESGLNEKNFTKTNSWQHPESRRRVRVWIEGFAQSNFGNPECTWGTGCTFRIRPQAQRRNIWGNWVYSSSYGPSLNVVNATWWYDYWLMHECTDYPLQFGNNITPASHPTSPYSQFWPWTNNGLFPLHPHTSGWWIFSGSPRYICSTIDVSYDIPAFYSIYGPSTWNLTN